MPKVTFITTDQAGKQRKLAKNSATLAANATISLGKFTLNAGEKVVANVFATDEGEDIEWGEGLPSTNMKKKKGFHVYYKKTNTVNEMKVMIRNLSNEDINIEWDIRAIKYL